MTPKGDQALRDIGRQFDQWSKLIKRIQAKEREKFERTKSYNSNPTGFDNLIYSEVQQLAKEIQNRHFNFVDDNLVILDSELMRMKREVEQ